MPYASLFNSILTNWQVISPITVGVGGSAAVDFTNIPSGFKRLRITVTGKLSGSSFELFRVNNDSTAAHYLYQRCYSNGAVSAFSSVSSTSAEFGVGEAGSTHAVIEISNTTAAGPIKNFECSGGSETFSMNTFGRWANTTDEINRLTLLLSAAETYAEGTRFLLEGSTS